MKLTHPSGAQVLLSEREGRNAVGLDLSRSAPELIGLNAAGPWTLEVVDLGRGDTGTLVAWGLTLVLPAPIE